MTKARSPRTPRRATPAIGSGTDRRLAAPGAPSPRAPSAALRPTVRPRRVRCRLRRRVAGRSVAANPAARARGAVTADPSGRDRRRREDRRRRGHHPPAGGAARPDPRRGRPPRLARRRPARSPSACCSCLRPGGRGASRGVWSRTSCARRACGRSAGAVSRSTRRSSARPRSRARPAIEQLVVARASLAHPCPSGAPVRGASPAGPSIDRGRRASGPAPRRPLRRLAVQPDDRLQGPLRRRRTRHVLRGPRRPHARVRVGAVPPALFDEHPPVVAAGAAVPVPRPQRRDQHRPRQSRGDGGPGRGPRRWRPRSPAGRAGPRRRADARSARLRLDLARRGRRTPGRVRLADRRGTDGAHARGARPAHGGDRRPRGVAGRERHARRALGRAGGPRVLGRRPRGCAARSQWAAARWRTRSMPTASSSPRPKRGRSIGRRPGSCAAHASGRATSWWSTRSRGACSRTRRRRPRRLRSARSSSRRNRPRPSTAIAIPTPTPIAPAVEPAPTDQRQRLLVGLDAEQLRVVVKAMATSGKEPIWSMGDDTPVPVLARRARSVAAYLRQAFAQVTNPPIDPERERVVVSLEMDVGRRAALLDPPGAPRRRRRS